MRKCLSVFVPAAIAVACFLMSVPASHDIDAQDPVGAIALDVLPSEGKSAGVVKTSSEGRWLVFAEGFVPVPNDAYKLSSGGSVVMWEGESGATFGVIFIPNDPTEGIAARQVVLGVVGPRPPPGPDEPPPSTDAARATYIYEKDQGGVPPEVGAALQKINADTGIEATEFEEDTTDGTGEVPSRLKSALTEAKRVGLPVLVVQSADGTIIRTVKDPQTMDSVLEAMK